MTTQDSRCGGLFVGMATIDILYVLDNIPPRNAKISVPGQQITAGGPATNAAITFAALGGSSTLITAVGRHALAAAIREDLDRYSVSLHDIAARETAAPPVSSILVMRDTGERTVVSPGATVFPPLSFELIPASFEGTSILLVDGHYMQLCIAAAQLARKGKIPVVLDGGSWKEGMEALLPWVDIAICSDDFRTPDCHNAHDAGKFLARAGITRVAITRGAAPIQYCQEGVWGEIQVERVPVCDTLGAGDIFHGAFCFSAGKGHAFIEALKFAAHVATFSCRHAGTRVWIEKFSGA